MNLGIIIGVVVGLVVLVVGLTIICDLVEAANFGGGSGTLHLVMDNIPLLLSIGGLVLAVGWAVMR